MMLEGHEDYCVDKEYAEVNSRKMNTNVVKSVLAVTLTKQLPALKCEKMVIPNLLL